MGHSNSILCELKGRLTKITDVLNPHSPIIYIDYPLHRNVGDLLINLGTESFFESQMLKVKRRYNLLNLPKRIEGVERGDTLVFHGGGNLGDLYPEHLDAMFSVLAQFPLNRAVQFPQTVFFQDDRQRESRCRDLKKYSQLDIFVRDSKSFAGLDEHGIPNLHLVPDMAHHLYGYLNPTSPPDVNRQLFFFRTDVEGGVVPARIANFADLAVDWDSCIHHSDRLALGFLRRFVTAARRVGLSIDVHRMWYHFRNNMARSGVEMLSQPQSIYTNRLHAMLLGVLLGRTVYWFDNSYGKLSSYVETWLRDFPKLSRVDSPTSESAPDMFLVDSV
jgi:pyruvyl transferase EpsO